ncbi:UNVERIFIED_CONTAM: hypothetical protein Sangu_0541800 [Sesamum angustifolium]|uniref:Calcineurin-like phosphoesterase domain-containing protein n=1 Tax=Sesamum angustifolium TaxID=2727405 RepID=A0AAW2Q9E7_9LAMI
MAQFFYSACACLQLPPRHPGTPSSSLYSSQLGSAPQRRIGIKQAVVTRPQVETDGCGTGTRVFVVSDLHTDYSENMCWVKSLSSRTHDNDVLVVAGDVAETYTNFLLTMSILKDKFRHVFFFAGLRGSWQSPSPIPRGLPLGSLDKLDKLLDACLKLGVETKPGIIDGLGVIPLYSWYHESFDGERDITGIRIPSLEMACKDFHVCKWPDDLKNGGTSLALYFDSLNDENWYIVEDILRRCSHIISFSHFVPRYVQAPLAYPRERKRRMNGGEDWLPFCIYSSGNFAERVSPCYWSDYYSVNPRTPEVTQLAPWVSRFYTKV